MEQNMKKSIDKSLNIVESWLDKKGFCLLRSKKRTIEDEVDFERKVVFLSLRSKPLYQLYSLLHECGHVVVRTSKEYKRKFAAHIAAQEGTAKTTICSVVQEVEEEILAWREGETLASKLGIDIDEEDYYKYGFKWVMGYIAIASIGRESHLPIAKESKAESNMQDKPENKEENSIDICKLLDNAYPVTYNKVIPENET